MTGIFGCPLALEADARPVGELDFRTKQRTVCASPLHLLLTDTEASLQVRDILSSSDPPQGP